MPPLRRKRRPKNVPAAIHFAKAKNEKNHQQTCVYAECTLSGIIVGPIWGHTEQSIRKAVATLTQECDCPARFHRVREYHGKRVSKNARRHP